MLRRPGARMSTADSITESGRVLSVAYVLNGMALYKRAGSWLEWLIVLHSCAQCRLPSERTGAIKANRQLESLIVLHSCV